MGVFSLSNKNFYKAIIIGGGSTGSSIIYNLVKKGVDNVLLVDKLCIGCGQTSRSSALIRLHYTHPVIRDMATYSWRFWKNKFVDETGCEYEVFRKTGIGFAGSGEVVETMKEVVNDLRKKNIDVSLYDVEDFKNSIYPHLDDYGIDVVAWEPQSGYCDPSTAVKCFTEFARRYGADIYEYLNVKKLIIKDGSVCGVMTEKGNYYGEIIVNAMGVWTNEVLKPMGLSLPIRTGREEVLYIKNPTNRSLVPPGWADLTLGFYSRPEGNNYTLIGGLDVEYVDIPPTPGEYSSPPIDLIKKRSEPFLKRFPKMLEATPHAGIFGFYDITPDWQPIIGFDSRIENLVHIVGLSGHGFKLAPAYGEVISDLIIHGYSKRFDIKSFSLDRFNADGSEHSKYKFGIIG